MTHQSHHQNTLHQSKPRFHIPNFIYITNILVHNNWSFSSVGRAGAFEAQGQRFEPAKDLSFCLFELFVWECV